MSLREESAQSSWDERQGVKRICGIQADGSLHPALEAARIEGEALMLRGELRRLAAEVEAEAET